MQDPTIRVLAIELRSQRFGFVLLEGHNTLLDWGICGYRRNISNILSRRLSTAASLFAPFLIVVRHRNRPKVLRNASLELLEQEAQRFSLSLEVLTASAVQEHFERHGGRNKYEISRIVANALPELAWRLPNKRKLWQSEPATQVLFDAAALALAYNATTKCDADDNSSQLTRTLWSAPDDE